MSDVGIIVLEGDEAHGAVTVTDTAGKIPATTLAGRRIIFIYNNGSEDIFLGSSTVTDANGLPLTPGASIEVLRGAAKDIYGICASGKTSEARYWEIAG